MQKLTLLEGWPLVRATLLNTSIQSLFSEIMVLSYKRGPLARVATYRGTVYLSIKYLLIYSFIYYVLRDPTLTKFFPNSYFSP